MRACYNTSMKKAMNRMLWKNALIPLPFALLLPFGFLIPTLAKGHTDWIETVYAARIYPVIRDGIASITSLTGAGVSIAEWLLYAVLCGAAVTLLALLIALLIRRICIRRAVCALLALAATAGLLMNLFYVTWGLNYFRSPLAERLELTVEPRGTEELILLCDRLSSDAQALREEQLEDADGVFTVASGTLYAHFAGIGDAYQNLGAAVPALHGTVYTAKSVFYSEGLSWLGIAGVYIGLTAEANVNTDQPPLLLLQGAAHENAHQLGIASENEAEFVAYLAGLYSNDAALRYSCVMNALIHCGNALAKADRNAYGELLSGYSDAMRRDFDDYAAYWDAFEGEIGETADQWNDSYLKHNEQESGVKSYGEVVDLLLSYYMGK